MLNQQTIEKLHSLKLPGRAEAFKDQLPQPDIQRPPLKNVSDLLSIASGTGKKTTACSVISKRRS